MDTVKKFLGKDSAMAMWYALDLTTMEDIELKKLIIIALALMLSIGCSVQQIVDSTGAYVDWLAAGHEGTYIDYVAWILANGGADSGYGDEVYAPPVASFALMSSGASGDFGPCPTSPYGKSDITGIPFEDHTPNPAGLLTPDTWEGAEAALWYNNLLGCLTKDRYFRSAVSGSPDNWKFHAVAGNDGWDMATIWSIKDPVGHVNPGRIEEPPIGELPRLLSDEPVCADGYQWRPSWCDAADEIDILMQDFTYPVDMPKTSLGWVANRHDWLHGSQDAPRSFEVYWDHIHALAYFQAQCSLPEAHCSPDWTGIGRSLVDEMTIRVSP